MMKNEYNFWSFITAISLLICLIMLIFSIFDLLNGNWLTFGISFVLVLQSATIRKLTQFSNFKIKELEREIDDKMSLDDSEYIIEQKNKSLQLKLKRLINELERKSKQNFYNLKQAVIIAQRQIRHLQKDINNNIQEIKIEQENLKNSLQNIQNGIYFDQLINIVDYKFLTLQSKIDEQKKYLYYVVSRSYQLGIRQMQELLIPIYEKQNYFEELQEIRKEQVRVAIQQLKMDLSHLQKQQNQDYSHLNRLILEPIKPLAPHIGYTQHEVVIDLQTKIDNLETILDRAILEYQATINNIHLATESLGSNNNILPESNLSETANDRHMILARQESSSLPNNIVASQLSDNQQLQMLNNIESVIQAEVENKSKEIDKIIETFSLQRENLDHLLEEKTRNYSQNFEVIYYNLNQINQLIMNLEGKYHSFTKANQKVNQKFKSVISQLYQREVKPLKTQVVTMADNNQYLIQKQTELEEFYYAMTVELKTEINKLKDEIFEELGQINDTIANIS